MKTRIITGMIGLMVFLPIVWIGGWPLVVGTLVLGLVAISELFKMKKLNFFSITGLLTSLMTILIVLPEGWLTFIPNNLSIWNLYFIYAMALMLITVFSGNTFTFDDAGVLLLASLYIGTGFHYFIQTAEIGFYMLMFVMIIIWSTDIGAYALGMKFGKNKLAPVVSPNKSIEGAIGGIVTAIVVGIIYMQFYNPFSFSIPLIILLVTVMSVFGQLGDLTESAYKRYFGVKDSGKILPGHGGILDRFDSTLFVMPLFQIILLIVQ